MAGGYLRQQDYSRKTEAVARERETVAEERAAVAKVRKQYDDLLAKAEVAMESVLPGRSDEEWAKLKREGPAQYAIQREEYRELQDKLDKVKTARSAISEEEMAEMQDQYVKHVAGEREQLLKALPTWKDDKVMVKDLSEIEEYALGVGFSEQQLAALVDHRAIVTLRKAMLYDRLQQGKPVVRKKARGAPVIKPGARKRPKPKRSKTQLAREKLKKTGSVKDAQSAFLGVIEAE